MTALREVGGPLVPAALDFVRSRNCPSPSRGVSGVRWLAGELDRYVEQEDGDGLEDDRFVEGAGAFLGLLLIEHLGGRTRMRDGMHRVQVGQFGWFDPFEAIHDALDAEEPRRSLAQSMAVAESEAAGHGAVSGVVRLFAETLQSERPDLAIRSQFALTLDLSSGASVDLARLEQIAQGQDHGAAVQGARRLISMLPDASGPRFTDWDEAVERIFPRLISERFVRSLPAEQALYLEPLGADVYVALQLRYDTRARFIPRAEIDSWGVGHEAAKERALSNLSACSDALRVEPAADCILRVRRGDGLDGARLLLRDLETRLPRIDRPHVWLAAAPHRDELLIAPSHAGERLVALSKDAADRAPHPISPALFAITAHGPSPRSPSR